MEYHGKLYGKCGGITFDTGKTTEDWDAMEKRVAELEALHKALSMSDVVGRSEQLACKHKFVDNFHGWNGVRKCLFCCKMEGAS